MQKFTSHHLTNGDDIVGQIASEMYNPVYDQGWGGYFRAKNQFKTDYTPYR